MAFHEHCIQIETPDSLPSSGRPSGRLQEHHSIFHLPTTFSHRAKSSASTQSLNRCSGVPYTRWAKFGTGTTSCQRSSFASITRSTDQPATTPFYLMYGYHPVNPIHFISDTNRVLVESVSRFSRRLEDIYKRAKMHIAAANEKYKARYDRLHRPAQFNVDDWVLLSTRHLHLRGMPTKLQKKFVGPFQVSAKIGGQAYTLRLPDDWKIHPTFYVSLLKPWRQDNLARGNRGTHSGVGARR